MSTRQKNALRKASVHLSFWRNPYMNKSSSSSLRKHRSLLLLLLLYRLQETLWKHSLIILGAFYLIAPLNPDSMQFFLLFLWIELLITGWPKCRRAAEKQTIKRPQGETLLYTDFQKKMSLTYLRTHKFSLARMTRLTATINTRRAAGAPMLSFCFLQLCLTPYSCICMWLAVLSQLHQWSSAGGQRLLSRGHTFSTDNPSFHCVVLLTNPWELSLNRQLISVRHTQPCALVNTACLGGKK